jgi:hypothetical protein
MSNSIPNIKLTTQWMDMYAATGLDIGKPLNIENVGGQTAELHIGATKPAERPANVGSNLLYPLATKSLSSSNLGWWARNAPNVTGAVLSINLSGGIQLDSPLDFPIFPSLFVKFDPFTQVAETASFALVRNRTDASMILEQLLNFESFSLGLQDGTSIVSLNLYFNPDITGSTVGVSIGKAYANDEAGAWIDITNTAVDIFDLAGFDPNLNPDFVRLAGGTVTYFETAQSTAVLAISIEKSFDRHFIIPPAGSFVIGYGNQGIIGGGTNTTTTSLFDGRFINDPINILPPTTADFNDEFTNEFA